MTSTGSPTAAFELPRTEHRNPASADLDALDSFSILTLLNDEDAAVPAAVRPALPALARLVDRALEALRADRRIHYFGAGTSGRLAVLDAAELIPTFTLEPGRVVAHIAGGPPALLTAVEGSEDSTAAGEADAAGLAHGDVAIGIAASGTTPYVRGALEEARRRGAFTALITSNPAASEIVEADLHLVADTGPEALTGSTRLKAGTAAKLLLNGFSTALMIRYGRTWSNLMVALAASNAKLRDRSVRIVVEATGLDPERAARLLEEAGGDVKVALVTQLGGADVHEADRALQANHGSVREALAVLGNGHRAATASPRPNDK